MNAVVACVADANCTLGEGPVWDERKGLLYWVDIKAPAVLRFDPKTGEVARWKMPEPIGAIALREKGGFVAAMKSGFALLNENLAGLELVARPEADVPTNRFNDGACDALGRFWAGTLDDNERSPTGHLYRLDADLKATRFDAGFVVTNGIRWSGDNRRLYFVNSPGRTIWAYEFDLARGVPGARRVFAQLAERDGYPDGLCVDADDHVWSAHWAGGRITRYRSEGTAERVIEIPAPHVTSCCFGGTNLDTLYVSTARIGLNAQTLERFPLAGGLFAVTGLGVRGRASPRFKG